MLVTHLGFLPQKTHNPGENKNLAEKKPMRLHPGASLGFVWHIHRGWCDPAAALGMHITKMGGGFELLIHLTPGRQFPIM